MASMIFCQFRALYGTNNLRARTTSVVVRSVLLARDEGLRVEERPVLSITNLVDDRRLKVDVDRARDVFALRSDPSQW